MEKSTELLISGNDKIHREEMHELLKKPVAYQRYMYAHSAIPHGYTCRLVIEKEDRVSVVEKSYALKMGTNGLFIKANKAKHGVTYHKKGKASQRLRVWGNDTHRVIGELMKILVKKVNPEASPIFYDTVIDRIATQGMKGYILAGNIKDRVSAMEYYIRYSLRGVGVDIKYAPALYSFFKAIDNPFIASSVLRCAVDPNSVLAKFQYVSDYEPTKQLVKVINNNGQRLCKQCLATGEKIDRADSSFDAAATAARLLKKEKGIKEFLDVWEGGPVLKTSSRAVNRIDQVHLFSAIDDL